MSRKAVLTGIARGRYGPDSKVSAIGGEAKAVADHPDFRGCFIPGSADELTIEVLKEEWEATARRAKWRRRVSLGGLLLAGAAGALWYSTKPAYSSLPETVENVEAQVERIRPPSKPRFATSMPSLIPYRTGTARSAAGRRSRDRIRAAGEIWRTVAGTSRRSAAVSLGDQGRAPGPGTLAGLVPVTPRWSIRGLRYSVSLLRDEPTRYPRSDGTGLIRPRSARPEPRNGSRQPEGGPLMRCAA